MSAFARQAGDRLILAVTLALVATVAPAALASEASVRTACTVVWHLVTGLSPC